MRNEDIVERLNQEYRPGILGFAQKYGCNVSFPTAARLSYRNNPEGDIVIEAREPHQTESHLTYSLAGAMDELEGFAAHYQHVVKEMSRLAPAVQPHSNPLYGSW